MRITFSSNQDRIHGFRFFWLKKVTGFNHEKKCCQCLLGKLHPNQISQTTKTIAPVFIDASAADIFYLCGVAIDFDYNKNFHLAWQVSLGSETESTTYNGIHIKITDAKIIKFDGNAALQMYPEKPTSYLKCRNFQFGAQIFAKN